MDFLFPLLMYALAGVGIAFVLFLWAVIIPDIWQMCDGIERFILIVFAGSVSIATGIIMLVLVGLGLHGLPT